MKPCPTCGSSLTCKGRLPLPPPGGWACRDAVVAGLVPGRDEELQHVPDRRPGWSRGAVAPCPICRNRPYAIGPNGLPERRCAGPQGCGHVWNPEALAA